MCRLDDTNHNQVIARLCVSYYSFMLWYCSCLIRISHLWNILEVQKDKYFLYLVLWYHTAFSHVCNFVLIIFDNPLLEMGLFTWGNMCNITANYISGIMWYLPAGCRDLRKTTHGEKELHHKIHDWLDHTSMDIFILWKLSILLLARVDL